MMRFSLGDGFSAVHMHIRSESVWCKVRRASTNYIIGMLKAGRLKAVFADGTFVYLRHGLHSIKMIDDLVKAELLYVRTNK